MRRIFLLIAVCGTVGLSAPTLAAGKYAGWTGQDCVGMGERCIANCDKYGVPETKAACMFNCSRVAMQCIDIVKGDAAAISPGNVEPGGTSMPPRRPPISRPGGAIQKLQQ
jgi:hypothetical protein